MMNVIKFAIDAWSLVGHSFVVIFVRRVALVGVAPLDHVGPCHPFHCVIAQQWRTRGKKKAKYVVSKDKDKRQETRWLQNS